MAPRLCHRLDRETSGILLVAKHPRTQGALMQQFEQREVSKEYLAIVWGALEQSVGRIDHPLAPARASGIRLKMAVAADGLAARTDWSVVERFDGYSLVRLELFTGRQHQIRVHLAALGHPVVGDKLYGPDDGCFERSVAGVATAHDLAALELPRQALHHDRLVFRTPASGELVEVRSPLARDLESFLADK
jgi:23S rRNA pseudouridine1911/1915/1917 synthase